jgi:hypothetical protein
MTCLLRIGSSESLPKDLPQRSSVNSDVRVWNEEGMLDRIHYARHFAFRELKVRGQLDRGVTDSPPETLPSRSFKDAT